MARVSTLATKLQERRKAGPFRVVSIAVSAVVDHVADRGISIAVVDRVEIHGLLPAHRDKAAMSGAQLYMSQGESSGMMSGPPALNV